MNKYNPPEYLSDQERKEKRNLTIACVIAGSALFGFIIYALLTI